MLTRPPQLQFFKDVSFFRLSHSEKKMFPRKRRLKSLSKYPTKEDKPCLVNEDLQLIDIDRVNDNLEQRKLFRLNHIKRSCIFFLQRSSSCFLIYFFQRFQVSPVRQALRQTWPFQKNTPKNS